MGEIDKVALNLLNAKLKNANADYCECPEAEIPAGFSMYLISYVEI